jgi:hypothetical protein
MDKGTEQTRRREGVCIYCGQTVREDVDGAWVEYEAGNSGCMAAVEAGSADGEHEAETSTIMEMTG